MISAYANAEYPLGITKKYVIKRNYLPVACSSFILSMTHFLSSRPMALESGGGTAFPT